MSDSLPRILFAIHGDLQNDPETRVKYSYLAQALERACGPVSACDASLRGIAHVFNAVLVFHPNFHHWHGRFIKNTFAFDAASRMVARQVKTTGAQMVFQINAIFDSSLYQKQAPVYIYTDATAMLRSREVESDKIRYRRWIKLEKNAYHNARHVFVRSAATRASLIAEYELPAERITVVGGGVNFSGLPEMPTLPRRSGEPIALFIGNSFFRKGGDILLKAFALVRQQMPNARLVLVTHDPIPRDLPLQNVDVLPPTWARESVMDLYRNSDVFVLPTREHTWSDALLEAMAFGLPCVASQSPAAIEILTNLESGLVVPGENPQALADALLRLLRDPALRIQVGLAARRRVESLFTWQRVAAAIHQTIQSLDSSDSSKEQK